MGIGKILGFAALGVGAVAAAPFTGGGSLFGAATLAASLAGAGAVAAGAGAAGAAAGYAMSRKEEEEEAAKDRESAELKLKAQKLQEGIEKALDAFQGDKEYFNYIIGVTALGISMANADGEISPEEAQEIEEFIGGIASSNYPSHVKEAIENLYEAKPNFNTAMTYLEKINPSSYESLKNLLELIVIADGIRHEKEEAFLRAFDAQIAMIEYKPEDNDTSHGFLLEAKSELVLRDSIQKDIYCEQF